MALSTNVDPVDPVEASFVVATYRRADALAATLASVVAQDDPRWEVVVVGDCCGPETEAALRAVADPRIRYYNLPERFGEQSGPNSAGLRLARGRHLAFLNHDDVLLPDHLSRALTALETTGSTFHVARFAIATGVADLPDGTARPVFGATTPDYRGRGMLMGRHDEWNLLEPSSAWLVDGALARRVGDWRPSTRVWRPPLRDWVLRAWRAGARFSFGDVVTGVEYKTHNRRAGLRYDGRSPEHEWLAARVASTAPGELRALIAGDRPVPAPLVDGATRAVPGRVLRFAGAWLYRATGFDLVVTVRRARGRTEAARRFDALLRDRTGESPPARSLERFLADPEACRVSLR